MDAINYISTRMNEAIQIKRNGMFHEASDIYSELNIRFPDHPGILKSWAKISVCQFKYNQAIEKFESAIKLYEEFNNQQEIFQCRDQISTINNRFNDPATFTQYYRAVSGQFNAVPKI